MSCDFEVGAYARMSLSYPPWVHAILLYVRTGRLVWRSPIFEGGVRLRQTTGRWGWKRRRI